MEFFQGKIKDYKKETLTNTQGYIDGDNKR